MYLPVELGECCEPLDADLGTALLGGLPPVDRGLPGGKLSATDIKAAIGLCPEPWAGWVCWVAFVVLLSGGEPVRVLRGECEFAPVPLATETVVVYPKISFMNEVIRRLLHRSRS